MWELNYHLSAQVHHINRFSEDASYLTYICMTSSWVCLFEELSWKQKETLCIVQAWNLSCSTTATYQYSVIHCPTRFVTTNTFSIFHLHLCLRGEVDYSLLLALLKYGTWRMLRCMLVPFTNLPREFYSWNDFYLHPFTSFQLHLSENWGWKKYASLIVGSLQGRLSLLSLWY